MRAAIITSKGAEEFGASEATKLAKATNIAKADTVVMFDIKDRLELARFTYRTQASIKVMALLGEFECEADFEGALKAIHNCVEKSGIVDWLPEDKTFRVECIRTGDHGFRSVDIEGEAGKDIIDFVEKTHKLTPDFENPDIRVLIYINQDKGYLGIDFSGIDLAKRQYKIFNHPESLKGTTGFYLVMESGFDGKSVLLDPFMGSGVIVIEAALTALGYPVQFFNKDKLGFTRMHFFTEYGFDRFFEEEDKKISDRKIDVLGYDGQLKYLKATQKNAKLAGIDKALTLSKSEIEWLDTKLEKGSVDLIVTDPPKPSKNKDDKKLEKLYNEFFYQAAYILKKKGIIVLLSRDENMLEKAAKNHNFKIIRNYLVNQGKEAYRILSFARSK